MRKMDDLIPLSITPFVPGDAFDIEVRPEQAAVCDHPDFVDLLCDYLRDGAAYTARDGKRIVFCGGVYVTAPRTGRVWFLACKQAREYWREIYFYAADYLDAHFFDNTLECIEATVQADWLAAQQFVERRLYFKLTGLLLGYGLDGSDHLLYRRMA